MYPALMSLPPEWETQVEFRTPGCGLAQPWHCGHLERELAGGSSPLCLPLCVCVSVSR